MRARTANARSRVIKRRREESRISADLDLSIEATQIAEVLYEAAKARMPEYVAITRFLKIHHDMCQRYVITRREE